MAEVSSAPWRTEAPTEVVEMSQSRKGLTYGFEDHSPTYGPLATTEAGQRKLPAEVLALVDISRPFTAGAGRRAIAQTLGMQPQMRELEIGVNAN